MKKLLFVLLILFSFVACSQHATTAQSELDTTVVDSDTVILVADTVN